MVKYWTFKGKFYNVILKVFLKEKIYSKQKELSPYVWVKYTSIKCCCMTIENWKGTCLKQYKNASYNWRISGEDSFAHFRVFQEVYPIWHGWGNDVAVRCSSSGLLLHGYMSGGTGHYGGIWCFPDQGGWCEAEGTGQGEETGSCDKVQPANPPAMVSWVRATLSGEGRVRRGWRRTPEGLWRCLT